jgi:hypothetical protein
MSARASRIIATIARRCAMRASLGSLAAARHQHRSAGFAPGRLRARPGLGFRFLGLVGYRKTRSDNALA